MQNEQAKLEIERGLVVTKADILAFIAEIINGDTESKEFQQEVIERLVNAVYAYDKRIIIYFNIKGGGKTVAFITKAETDEKTAVTEVSGTADAGGG